MAAGNYNIRQRTRELAFFSIMLALITVLSFVESAMPPLPLMPPNVKLGLSNIVTMYCLFFIDSKSAFMLAALKSAFVFLTRGLVAGILSFSGGLCSITVICFLLFVVKKDRISYLMMSVCGAISHNFAQLFAASILMQYNIFIYYFPVSVAAGVIMGSATGCLLRVVLPAADLFKEKSNMRK